MCVIDCLCVIVVCVCMMCYCLFGSVFVGSCVSVFVDYVRVSLCVGRGDSCNM